MNDPLRPKRIATEPIANARAMQVRFCYAFVTAADGLQVIDVTKPAKYPAPSCT